MNNDPAGSIWRKWDLHIHTPLSIVNNYGGSSDEVWERFIKDLESLPSEHKVIGINDYIFVDGYERVLNEKTKNGRLKNIDLILPVVELRLDKFCGVVKRDADGKYSKSDWNRINLHVIFDQIEPEIIRQQFLSGLVQSYQLIPESNQFKNQWKAVITPESLTQLGQMIIDAAPEEKRGDYSNPLEEGFNNLNVSLDSIREAISRHDLRDRVLLAVGKTEWENMKWTDQSIAEKRNMINSVDLVFTASENPQSYIGARQKLTQFNVLDKLLDCSDAHAFSDADNKDRIGNCFTWIKADTTFEGLRQAVTEFDQRVFVGDKPPKRTLVLSNRTKYVSEINVGRREKIAGQDVWFDERIPLNHDLVAIIGNKGSGKSALADIIALVGDTKNHNSFSFLNERRFRDPRAKLAGQFEGHLLWHDKTSSIKNLGENPNPSSVERIKYLPQSYLETLCNELAANGSATFDAELRKIIYTHVPEESRLGFQSLDELLNFNISELKEERKQLADALSRTNREISSVEKKLSLGFQLSLELQLNEKKKELASLEEAKPTPVENPLESDAEKQATALATSELQLLENSLAEMRNQEEISRLVKAEAVRRYAHTGRILQAIKNHRTTHGQFITELADMLAEVDPNLRADDIVSMNIDITSLEKISTQFSEQLRVQDELLSGGPDGGLVKRQSDIRSEIENKKNKLGEKQRLYLAYKDKVTRWEKAKDDIQGNPTKTGTISWYENEIQSLTLLPGKREALRVSRLSIVRNLHSQLSKIVSEYRTLYEPMQGFVQTATKMEMPLPLSFDVRITEDGFQESFLNRINRQTRGSFSGVEESNLIIALSLRETDFNDTDSVLAFVERIDSMLHFDKRSPSTESVELEVSDQLRKGNSLEELYDYIFGLQYLSPQYSLTYDNQEISQLSPGERGLLLLVFYLLVDKDDIPLVIDQPEENLDNQTIFRILVTCIKKAKERRQVIMVTHNPNLAVVCDAEQIICASCDKVGKRFSYISGAIESPAIKQRVIEILEGTQPAFINRKIKYGY